MSKSSYKIGFAFSRVLVTGGAGFVGRPLAECLAAAGADVLVIDNESVGRKLPPQTTKIKPALADIRDDDAMASLFETFQPEAVVHLAALHHIPTCEKKRVETLDVNVTSTERLLACAERSSSVRAVLLASSGAVSDWIDGPLLEDSTPVAAHDNYGLSKWTNEGQLVLWAQRTGRRARAVRLFNVIGPDDPNAHLIPDICRQIRPSDREVALAIGNVMSRRDYVPIDDAIQGFFALLAGMDSESRMTRTVQPGRAEVFNVCTGTEHSVLDVIDAIASALACKITVTTDPSRVRRFDRPPQLGSPREDVRRYRVACRWRLRSGHRPGCPGSRGPGAFPSRSLS